MLVTCECRGVVGGRGEVSKNINDAQGVYTDRMIWVDPHRACAQLALLLVVVVPQDEEDMHLAAPPAAAVLAAARPTARTARPPARARLCLLVEISRLGARYAGVVPPLVPPAPQATADGDDASNHKHRQRAGLWPRTERERLRAHVQVRVSAVFGRVSLFSYARFGGGGGARTSRSSSTLLGSTRSSCPAALSSPTSVCCTLASSLTNHSTSAVTSADMEA